ncbi:hypothetical protein BJ912DRAFT_877553 [Pholiota molesta]|nr:hypothetical protein BJ912DRAFT_877553 [Pholiota molesta]
MPRILPRLIEKIKAQATSQKSFPSPALKRKKKPKSLYKPVPPSPSFKPADYPQASLLLAPQNPVGHAKDYVRHKTLPPRPSPALKNSSKLDAPRQMTEQEFGWWANPYLRMLTSPLRKCAITGRHLPSDLLIRLVPVSIPASVLHGKKSTQSVATLVPDGLQHPKYAARQRSGGAVYALCWRQLLSQTQKGFHNPASPGAVTTPRVQEHVAHLLRLRVLQEFELLAENLEKIVRSRKNYGSSDAILRRLTHDEWELVKSTGSLPYNNVAAVLVVPSVDVDLVTQEQLPSNMSALPPDDEEYATDCPPISTLHSAKLYTWSEDLPKTLPLLNTPLYNAISAFPSRSQRATLHTLLLRVLDAETSYKRINSECNVSPSSNPEHDLPSDASDAFLFCSDAFTAKRGDTAAVALALWRLKMYESEGWVDNGGQKISP